MHEIRPIRRTTLQVTGPQPAPASNREPSQDAELEVLHRRGGEAKGALLSLLEEADHLLMVID